jgi:hypothetical protein
MVERWILEGPHLAQLKILLGWESRGEAEKGEEESVEGMSVLHGPMEGGELSRGTIATDARGQNAAVKDVSK